MNDFKQQLIRQFGKSDAEAFSLAPHKYCHHFDAETDSAYKLLLAETEENERLKDDSQAFWEQR